MASYFLLAYPHPALLGLRSTAALLSFFTQGELDDRVPFVSAEKSARLIKGYGVNITFRAYPTKGHVLVDADIIALAEDFILRHAPGQKVDLLRRGLDRFLEVVSKF